MVDHYYSHEDDFTAPEVELDNLNAQDHALSTVVTETVEHVNRAVQLGDWLESRQQDIDDQAFVREMVTITNTMGTRITQQAIAHKSAGAFAKRMFEMHQQLARAHNDTSDKLDEIKAKLADLREEIDDTMKEAYESVFAEMHNNIKQLTGCDDWGLIYRFNDLLVGNNEDPTPEQIELLGRLLATFEQSSDQPEQE